MILGYMGGSSKNPRILIRRMGSEKVVCDSVSKGWIDAVMSQRMQS